ncbi:MAG: substrate-binding periplasmic protein [Solirubrobacterales bacterium]
MRWAWLVSLAMLLLAVPAGAQETVVLGADPWCPHTCDAGPDRPGYMIELAQSAFALHGVRVVYTTAPWARVMAEVRDGKLDGAVGVLRAEAADLTLHEEALGMQTNAFAVRKGDPWTFGGLDTLKGRIVATIKDYSYSSDLDAWLASDATEVQAAAGENALEKNLRKLVAGRVDVVVEDAAVLKHRLRKFADRDKIAMAGGLEGGELFIAFANAEGRNQRLTAMLDSGIRSLRASGELNRILAKYGLKDWKG